MIPTTNNNHINSQHAPTFTSIDSDPTMDQQIANINYLLKETQEHNPESLTTFVNQFMEQAVISNQTEIIAFLQCFALINQIELSTNASLSDPHCSTIASAEDTRQNNNSIYSASISTSPFLFSPSHREEESENEFSCDSLSDSDDDEDREQFFITKKRRLGS